jgi:hypothetical protein
MASRFRSLFFAFRTLHPPRRWSESISCRRWRRLVKISSHCCLLVVAPSSPFINIFTIISSSLSFQANRRTTCGRGKQTMTAVGPATPVDIPTEPHLEMVGRGSGNSGLAGGRQARGGDCNCSTKSDTSDLVYTHHSYIDLLVYVYGRYGMVRGWICRRSRFRCPKFRTHFL